MSKLNPVFTALTDIDDSIITGAKKSRKKPIAIVLVAAAAVMALVGFRTAFRYGVSVNDKDVFDYHLTVQSMTIPTHDEMEALGAVNQHKSEYSYEWKTLPSTLFKTFGVSPLMNDNFSETECDNFVWVNCTNDGAAANTSLNYELTDKALDKTVKFQIFCMNKEGAGLHESLSATDAEKEKMETLTLADGSKAIIFEDFLGGYNFWVSHAKFNYDGIAYSLYLRDGNNEDMKQVLSDLGVL